MKDSAGNRNGCSNSRYWPRICVWKIYLPLSDPFTLITHSYYLRRCQNSFNQAKCLTSLRPLTITDIIFYCDFKVNNFSTPEIVLIHLYIYKPILTLFFFSTRLQFSGIYSGISHRTAFPADPVRNYCSIESDLKLTFGPSIISITILVKKTLIEYTKEVYLLCCTGMIIIVFLNQRKMYLSYIIEKYDLIFKHTI